MVVGTKPAKTNIFSVAVILDITEYEILQNFIVQLLLSLEQPVFKN